jgi:putative redox protein
MAESIYVRQSITLETLFQASFSGTEADIRTVEQLHELTPYGMMLASLGSCTAMVVNTFAQNHDYPLEEVGIRLKYERTFKEDCENCTEIDRYEETIYEEIEFFGSLTDQQRSRLAQVAHLCPIYKMFKRGVEIQTQIIKR